MAFLLNYYILDKIFWTVSTCFLTQGIIAWSNFINGPATEHNINKNTLAWTDKVVTIPPLVEITVEGEKDL